MNMESDLDRLSRRHATKRAICVITHGLAASLLSVFAVCMVLESTDAEELAHFIRRSFACDSKGGDEAVGLA